MIMMHSVSKLIDVTARDKAAQLSLETVMICSCKDRAGP